MHELAIVEALIEQVQQELERAGQQGPVARLELCVGRLSGANPDSIRFAFGLLASETVVEGAELLIAEPKAVCHCRDCEARTEIDVLAIQCPRCESSNITIEGGRELTLQSIDLKDD